MNFPIGEAMHHQPRRYPVIFQSLVLVSCMTLSAVISHLAVAHYPATLPLPPALRGTEEDRPIPVLGARVGRFAPRSEAESVQLLRSLAIPVDRTLILHTNAIDHIWLPAKTMAEAFAICSRFADVSVECEPTVVSSNQLEFLDGNPVGENDLQALGITRYRPVSGRWTKVVRLTIQDSVTRM